MNKAFPYWNKKQIRMEIKKLKNIGYIEIKKEKNILYMKSYN